MRPKNTGIPDPRKIIISKDELYKKYIEENMPRRECAEFFGVSEKVIIRRLSEYGIKRNPKRTYENRKKAMLKKYGVEHASQDPELYKKARQTMLERYGTEYTAQSPELQAKMQKTMMQKYHKSNFVETDLFKKKSKKTCQEKYGVKYPCQFPQCINALENNVGPSKPEQEFAALLNKYNIKYEREHAIRGFKYDFKVGNLLFEINPSATHNSTFGVFGAAPKPKSYHYTKYSVAKEYDYRCIHVFDWDDPDKVIKLFLINKQRIFARKCELRSVSLQEARKFLNQNHLQGYARDEIRLGLYYENALVEIMTFARPRYTKKYEWELVRLCSIANVVGGSERLLHEFVSKYKPASIISYCDLSKFDGRTYTNLGFKLLDKKPKPSKHWVNLKTGQHITDNLLRKKGYDQLFKTNYGKGTSNEQLMLDHGFVEIYDCGQLTYVLNNLNLFLYNNY